MTLRVLTLLLVFGFFNANTTLLGDDVIPAPATGWNLTFDGGQQGMLFFDNLTFLGHQIGRDAYSTTTRLMLLNDVATFPAGTYDNDPFTDTIFAFPDGHVDLNSIPFDNPANLDRLRLFGETPSLGWILRDSTGVLLAEGTVEATPKVPEPATFILMGLGLLVGAGVIVVRKKLKT